ncbi:MAG: hypothetical protein WC584_01950 [Candidatus Pacearchaeota archaeon]
MRHLGQKLKQVGVVAGLVGCSLGMNGCQTVTKTNTLYGNPIRKQEVTEGKEIGKKYLISNLTNLKGRLDIQVSEQKTRMDNIITYDIVPITYETAEVKKRAKGSMIPVGTMAYFGQNLIFFGVPLGIDSIILLSGNPEKTIFNSWIMGGKPEFYYIDESSKKIVSTEKSEEKRKGQTLKKHTPISSSRASNIPVRVYAENSVLQNNANELIKNTDAEGRVVFQINEKSGKIKVETLAKDGENDRIELK